MGQNLAQKLLASHLLEGEMQQGNEIALKIDQTLTQDATGTMVMLELEAMGLDRAKTDISVQYVDHNLVQNDFKNPEDHLFLRSACKRFGIWYSRAGNGVSHPVHMERFGKPGKTLLGSDSHTCAAGSMGMLAMGAGGLEVAFAIAGEPFHVKMPEIFGIKLVGELPDWVSAKDVVLEVLRRYDVSGGVGKILEYYGPGLEGLSAMDRHVIANMGAELGATASVFPADEVVHRFLKSQHREDDFESWERDDDSTYDSHAEIDLSKLEPLIAKPSSPGNVVPISELEGLDVFQVMIGSSANPGYRDFAIVADILEDQQVHDQVSLDINPTSRQILENLARNGHLAKLIRSGARIHQAGCNGCIGMGQAPAVERPSLRTVPRNFPGRSGTKEDAVYLCSPEVGAAAALTGKVTDPRKMGIEYPKVEEPDKLVISKDAVIPPPEDGRDFPLDKGGNIKPLPHFEPLPESLEGAVLIKLGDNVSTDEIMPAGSKVLPFRSNIPAISDFVFNQVDESYPSRARMHQERGHFIIGGKNYGQGSSREHAAIAPRFLGVRAVLVKDFARIHRSNLSNFGIVPLTFIDPEDWEKIALNTTLSFPHIREEIQKGNEVTVIDTTEKRTFKVAHNMTPRELRSVLEGGMIGHFKSKNS
ncbi:MAG: 3-isopropylmalate dehydratase large subunit [Chlamydiales bacterium]|nr:3-isopropylmalate dehydratase large subunit [Chlamydiales bacterium]MCH9620463.1 3-isopropylmalate dehydratase large subunit [Chlamydiales bacterium]MCH9623449.1 3-isopropylmalate dehydratase large subunit [Chlamydiales bacterium]